MNFDPSRRLAPQTAPALAADRCIVVEGATPDTLKTAMQKSVGETLRLKIKHGADASQDVSLIAVPKPP